MSIDGDAVPVMRTNVTASAGEYQQNSWTFTYTLPNLLAVKNSMFTDPTNPNAFLI